MIRARDFVLLPVVLSIVAFSLGAQPNIPVMKERTAGLDRIAVIVEVRASSSASHATVSQQQIAAALLKQISDEGAVSVPRDRANLQTLLMNVKISCGSESPFCAIVILYSRFASSRTDDRAPQLVVWLVGPADIQGKNWTATATQLRAYSEEGALVASRLVRRSRP
jgi:hypothetical protein